MATKTKQAVTWVEKLLVAIDGPDPAGAVNKLFHRWAKVLDVDVCEEVQRNIADAKSRGCTYIGPTTGMACLSLAHRLAFRGGRTNLAGVMELHRLALCADEIADRLRLAEVR